MMRKTIPAFAAAFLFVAVALSSPATAVVNDTHDFEGFGHMTPITTQYAGYLYDGATTLCAPNYNYVPYPPSSGDCVVYAPATGTVTIDLAVPATAFQAEFVRASGPLTIELSLLGLVVVETIDCGHATTYVTTTCGSTLGLPFNTVTVTGTANFYVFDDATFSL